MRVLGWDDSLQVDLIQDLLLLGRPIRVAQCSISTSQHLMGLAQAWMTHQQRLQGFSRKRNVLQLGGNPRQAQCGPHRGRIRVEHLCIVLEGLLQLSFLEFNIRQCQLRALVIGADLQRLCEEPVHASASPSSSSSSAL